MAARRAFVFGFRKKKSWELKNPMARLLEVLRLLDPTPPTPDCPTCPTRTHHPEAEAWAKNLLKDYAIDELKLMPVQVTFSMAFNYPNEPTTYHETHKLAPMPANQLPMAQLTLKNLIADANATGKVNVQITNITVKPVPDRHFQPAVIQEAEAWASQKLTGHQLPFN